MNTLQRVIKEHSFVSEFLFFLLWAGINIQVCVSFAIMQMQLFIYHVFNVGHCLQ